MGVFPFPQQFRERLAQDLYELVGPQDALTFLQRTFKKNPGHEGRIVFPKGLTPLAFYQHVIYHCELRAWSERPPLIVELLRAFEPRADYVPTIETILEEGPFQCHRPGEPYWVSRVTAELPLLGRNLTRAAARAFDPDILKFQGPKRVLRVSGPEGSGKTHTLSFFRYLSAIQPMTVGVIQIDFSTTKEIVTQAASANIPVELYLAQQLAKQVHHRRKELEQIATDGALEVGAAGVAAFPDLVALPKVPEAAHTFQPLTDLAQRPRWVKELVGQLVDVVLRTAMPRWWVAVFDNCEQAPPEAQEFVRQLVGRVAGTGPGDADAAAEGPLRIVLLGDSAAMLPSPLYFEHVVDEDLSTQSLGQPEVELYFVVVHLCRGIKVEAERIKKLTTQSLDRAKEIMAADPQVPWLRALARAVIEKTLHLEKVLDAQKRSEP